MFDMKKILLIILVFFLAGCGRVSEKTIENILEKDPSFESLVSSKKRIEEKVLVLRNKLNKEKDFAIQEIKRLKTGVKYKENEYKARITSLKHQLDPEIQELQIKLVEKQAEYKGATKKLGDVVSKLGNIKKLLEKKSELSLSGDEISIWNKRVVKLEKDIASIQKKLDKLRSKVSILKTEIQILKR